jgi:hypothetical protein
VAVTQFALSCVMIRKEGDVILNDQDEITLITIAATLLPGCTRTKYKYIQLNRWEAVRIPVNQRVTYRVKRASVDKLLGV